MITLQEMSQSELLISIAAFALLVPNAPREQLDTRFPNALVGSQKDACDSSHGHFLQWKNDDAAFVSFGAVCWQPTGHYRSYGAGWTAFGAVLRPVGPPLGLYVGNLQVITGPMGPVGPPLGLC